jgi:hypothetical protein
MGCICECCVETGIVWRLVLGRFAPENLQSLDEVLVPFYYHALDETPTSFSWEVSSLEILVLQLRQSLRQRATTVLEPRGG